MSERHCVGQGQCLEKAARSGRHGAMGELWSPGQPVELGFRERPCHEAEDKDSNPSSVALCPGEESGFQAEGNWEPLKGLGRREPSPNFSPEKSLMPPYVEWSRELGNSRSERPAG